MSVCMPVHMLGARLVRRRARLQVGHIQNPHGNPLRRLAAPSEADNVHRCVCIGMHTGICWAPLESSRSAPLERRLLALLGLYSYGIDNSYGLYSYGLYSYGLYRHMDNSWSFKRMPRPAMRRHRHVCGPACRHVIDTCIGMRTNRHIPSGSIHR